VGKWSERAARAVIEAPTQTKGVLRTNEETKKPSRTYAAVRPGQFWRVSTWAPWAARPGRTLVITGVEGDSAGYRFVDLGREPGVILLRLLRERCELLEGEETPRPGEAEAPGGVS
jgi:hypothetical protein